MKTKIITKNENITEIELDLPFYSKIGKNLFYCITDEKTCIGFSIENEMPHYSILPAECGCRSENIPIDREEYIRATEIFINLINKK